MFYIFMEDRYVQTFSGSSKSPLILLSILGVLIIATLVMISSYFLRPSIEIDLRDQLSSGLSKAGIVTPIVHVSGMDVTLKGVVLDQSKIEEAEKTAKKVWGVRRVNNYLSVESQQNK